MADQKESSAERERRRYRRSAVLLSATLYCGAERFAGHVSNISVNGIKLSIGRPLPQGTTGTVTIDRFGTFPVEVVWSAAGTVGLRFLEDPEGVAELLRAALPGCGLDGDPNG